MNKGRVESFSDGVFAFAITLLVLGIQVPDLKTGSDQEVREGLIRSLPQLVPYVTSFATIGIIWLNHHAMFHGVERVEHTTLTLNLLLLLVVAFIPYPTAGAEPVWRASHKLILVRRNANPPGRYLLFVVEAYRAERTGFVCRRPGRCTP